jgi:hypothetical protein
MNADKTVTAKFVQLYTLTIAANGNGTTNPPVGTHIYDPGTVVSITATPDTGSKFDSWSGDASGTTSTITITMDSDKSLTAYFEELPKLTLADPSKVLDLSSQLPSGFAGSYSSELQESDLLGTGSGSQFYTRGTVLVTNPWYQIQLILWVVDNEVAQNTSVEEVLAEYHLTGDHITVGNNADAIKNGDYGSGLEFLVIKYQNAYVVMNSWYSHPQDEYVDMIQLAKVIVERLSGYSY